MEPILIEEKIEVYGERTLSLTTQEVEFLQENLIWLMESDYILDTAKSTADGILTKLDEE